MQPISEMNESVDINTISTNNASDNISLNCGQNPSHLGGMSTPVTTPEPKSVSNPSGSRSEIHYPGVQNPSRIYDSKKNRKIVRIMTVMAYMFAVSLAAIVLSIYYAFLWNPNMQTNSNSTHFNLKITNLNTDVMSTIDSTDDTNAIDSNRVEMSDQVVANEQPIVSSAQLSLMTSLSGNKSDSGLTSGSLLLRPAISTMTYVKNSYVFVSNSTQTLIDGNKNVSKDLMSKTFASNVDKIISNKNIGREETTKILDKTNRTEINTNSIVDNQIEISLNTSQTKN